MLVQKAIEINAKVPHTMSERINNLPGEKAAEAYFDPENHRGDIELILAEGMK